MVLVESQRLPGTSLLPAASDIVQEGGTPGESQHRFNHLDHIPNGNVPLLEAQESGGSRLGRSERGLGREEGEGAGLGETWAGRCGGAGCPGGTGQKCGGGGAPSFSSLLPSLTPLLPPQGCASLGKGLS